MKIFYNNFLLISFSILIVLLISEFVLRALPLKTIYMATGVFDENTLDYKRTPNSKFIRYNIRGEKIIRDINSDGFMENNHRIEKGPNKFRIGFFGDSYVESEQVDISKAWFSIIQDSLNNKNIEVFAFGKSGIGTVQSYLNYKHYSKIYDLDLIVYVFCENDVGDNIDEIRGRSYNNSTYLSKIVDGELKIIKNTDFIKKQLYNIKISDFPFYKNSILIQTIHRRLRSLKQHGIKMNIDQDDFTLSGKSKNIIPNQNDLPSTWESSIKNKAKNIISLAINRWEKEVVGSKKEFAIFYIPRQIEWKHATKEQDSWKKFMVQFSIDNKINFIDPTDQFFSFYSKGKLFDDHFSELGHLAFAHSFIEWISN